MKWIEPLFSKKQVRKAGEKLTNIATDHNELSSNLEILSNWRAVHAYPMHSILIFLRRKSKEVDSKSIVVQRLKRTPSIIRKLVRFNRMKLDRMQDIGGCRAVVANVKFAEKLADEIIHSRTRNKLHKIKDYIVEPKDSGYRGIHLVYKYRGEKNKYSNLFIEIQIRSKIQHSWATAVEIVDTFTKQALKSSYGDKKWLNCFEYISDGFALMEKRPMSKGAEINDVLNGVVEYIIDLDLVRKLAGFTLSAHRIYKSKVNKTDYYILEIAKDLGSINIANYSSRNLKEATEKYLELEKKSVNNNNLDVVMVSASSLTTLKAAYPNYFADSKEFINNIQKLMGYIRKHRGL